MTRKNNSALVFMALAAILLVGCGGDNETTPDNIGGCDGVGGVPNYALKGSKCYGEDGQVIISYDVKTNISITETLSDEEIQDNCAKYGRMYNWYMAIKVCPVGWHLPNDEEWVTLLEYVGCWSAAGIKSTSGWTTGNGTDEYGFSALPGGYGYGNSGYFSHIGSDGKWWSATYIDVPETWDSKAWYWWMWDNSEVIGSGGYKETTLCSVRCIAD